MNWLLKGRIRSTNSSLKAKARVVATFVFGWEVFAIILLNKIIKAENANEPSLDNDHRDEGIRM